MGKVAIFLAKGYEEIEALTVVDMLRRAKIEIDMVSISNDDMTEGSHGICTKADKRLSEINFDEYNMLVLPGGGLGSENLEGCEVLMEQFDRFYREGKNIAAICAAPSIFGHRGYLKGRKAGSYPTFEEQLEGAQVVREAAVRDGNVITGRGMGCAIDFSLMIIDTLKGKDEADRIANQIIYSR